MAHIRMAKRGRDSIQNNTIHYKIVINFVDGCVMELLETKDKNKL